MNIDIFFRLIYISLLAVGNNYKQSAIGCRIWIPYIYMYQVYESNLLFFENVNGKATCFPKVVKYSGILVRERDKFWHRTPKIRGFYSIKLIQHVVRITKKWRWINISMKIIVMFVLILHTASEQLDLHLRWLPKKTMNSLFTETPSNGLVMLVKFHRDRQPFKY